MPMIGIIDPRGKEAMPDSGILPDWMTPEQALKSLADDELGYSSWTYELLAAGLDNIQERGDNISTTALLGCTRSEILKRRENYVTDLNDLWAALRGTMIHRTLELGTPKDRIAEVRFFTEIDGIEISAQPDHLTSTALADYKVPADQNSIPMTYLYNSQTEQLMLNAYIARHCNRWEPNEPLPFDPRDHPVEQVGIVFVGPKRPKVMLYKKSIEIVGPSGKPRKVRVPYVWSDKEVLESFRPRLHLFYNALQSYPDWPTPWTDADTGKVWTAEEVWGGEPGWECPGWPVCKFTTCLAKRKPGFYTW